MTTSFAPRSANDQTPNETTETPNPKPFQQMRNLAKLSMAAGFSALTAIGAHAQNFGESCGCPSLGSRTPVTLNNASSPLLVNANNEFIGNVTLTCGNLYTCNTKLYVTAGNTLTIEPGTVLKWADNSGVNANALIVTRGAQIVADGSESCPIIMTSTADPLDGSYAVTNRGKWGGLILLGNGQTNVQHTDQKDATGVGTSTSIVPPASPANNGLAVIEGLVNTDSRHYYGALGGAFNNTESSGILRHVALRHGGELLGTANEINGLTMGGVGSGTVIDYVEVTSNLDDGFEFFGGTVNAKHLVAMHCDDDYIDYDQGYTGKLQFIFGLQGPDNLSGGSANQGDNGIEGDGDDGPGNTDPLKSNPTIYNATIFGRWTTTGGSGDESLEIRREAKGTIANSVFANFRSGISLATSGGDVSYANWSPGNDFQVLNCTFQIRADQTDVDPTSTFKRVRVGGANASPADYTLFGTDNNLSVAFGSLVDASFATTLVSAGPPPVYNNTVTDRVNPIPAFGQATTSLLPPSDGFFTKAAYRGAFEPGGESWLPRWTMARTMGTDKTTFNCVGDLNGDYVVNSADFSTFVGRFGSNCN